MLTDRETALIDLAAAHYKYPAAREAAAREQFGIGPTAFYVEVAALLDRPDALEYDAPNVRRLQRLRERRRVARSAR